MSDSKQTTYEGINVPAGKGLLLPPGPDAGQAKEIKDLDILLSGKELIRKAKEYQEQDQSIIISEEDRWI